MEYINLVAYVQRKIDNIFRAVRTWTQAYIDDIMCGAKPLPDLLDKLRTLFEIFLAYNISISPTKSYLNYPSVVLLSQRVDSLGLTTFVQKLKAIKLLTYPNTLRALKYYLAPDGLPEELHLLLCATCGAPSSPQDYAPPRSTARWPAT